MPSKTELEDRVRATQAKARRNGKDAVQALFDENLILTDHMRHLLQMEALQDLRRELDKWRPAEFLRRVTKSAAPTPDDMHRAILGFVDEYLSSRATRL